MSARLKALWLARTPRERWLLGVMLALAVLVLAWLLILRPLGDMLSAARQRHGEAVAALGEARSQAAAIAALERNRPPAERGAPASAAKPPASIRFRRASNAAGESAWTVVRSTPSGEKASDDSSTLGVAFTASNKAAAVALKPAPPPCNSASRWVSAASGSATPGLRGSAAAATRRVSASAASAAKL